METNEKANKLLAEIRGELLAQIIGRCQHTVRYFMDNPEELQKTIEYIANPIKWEYAGILSDKKREQLKTIKFLLDEDRAEMSKYYDEFKP